MEQLLQVDPLKANAATPLSGWRNPTAWLQQKKLSRNFWVFFAVAFFFDFGFAVYYFLFNLYLLDLHFNERSIGLIAGALTLGSVVGTLPAGWLARSSGLRIPLVICFIAAPLLGIARATVLWEPAQIGLAFLAGLAMCIWTVCFLPTLASLTTEQNRASAFSLIFSVGIGSSALGGLVCGYLPHWLKMAGFTIQAAEVKRIVLVLACSIAVLGLFPLLRLKLPTQALDSEPQIKTWRQPLKLNPFLLRFLPAMALWTAALAAFMPFSNVYLSRGLNIPLAQIGIIFSVSHLVQLFVGLLTPWIFRWLGLVDGIAATQFATAIALALMALTHNQGFAVALFLSFSAAQWMSSPGLYNLLMSKMPNQERSTASAMTMFCNALVQSCVTAGAGFLFLHFGYPRVLAGIAVLALMAAILFRVLVVPVQRCAQVQP